MLFLQNYTCAICHRALDELEHGLVVDHDHVTGKVRALLCGNCNTALGLLGDDVARIQRAAEYVNLWKEENDALAQGS
jgi:uncharacterized CHY-type Zn-finger protein